MKSLYLLILLLCVTPYSAFANGDPVARLSSLTRSANPSPRSITDIEVLKEELYIQPSHNTTVRVKYVLHNTSNKDYVNIDYGFPVDYTGVGMVNASLSGNDMSESVYAEGWHDDYIQKMSFAIDGKTLPYTMSSETVAARVNREELKEGYKEFLEEGETISDYELEQLAQKRDIARRWFYTQFSIGAGQTCELEVEYTLRNQFTVPLYSLNLPYQSGKGEFYYYMSPAQYWGNGKAKELLVEIDFSKAVSPQDALYSDYDIVAATGLPFTQVGDKLTYTSNDFDFKTSKPIELNYFANTKPDYAELLKYRILPSAYRIKASEELSAYPVSNLSDLKMSTAWAMKLEEGKEKKITIAFKKPTRVGAIIIVGGYHKSADTYKNNAQPKTFTIRVDSIDEPGLNYSVDENFAKNRMNYTGISDQTVLDYSVMYTRPVFADNYNKPVKEITIDINEVYPGEKFNDLCISEIILISPDYAPLIDGDIYK